RAAAEPGGEERAEAALILIALAEPAAPSARRPPELEPFRPARRGPELLAGLPLAAQLIVGRALLGVLQDLVGLLELLEFLLGVRLFADVRVELARQAAVRLLDLVRGRRTGHAEYLVIIPVFHECLSLGSPGGWSRVARRGRWGHLPPNARA